MSNALRTETYTVKLPDGRIVSKQIPAGASDEQVRAAFAREMRGEGIDSRRQQVQRGNALLKEHKPGVSERLGDYISAALAKVGMDEREAYRLGNKFERFFVDLSPAGNVDNFLSAESDFEKQLAILPLPGPAKQAIRKGIRAWHGSPHDFDKFDLNKIGTGEGAQAYGHGLYFAENKEVAEEYQRNLTKRAAKPTFEGRLLDTPTAWQGTMNELENAGNWRNAKALEMVDSFIRQHGNADVAGRELRNWYRDDPKMLAAVEQVLPKVEMQVPAGRLYEVNINAEPEDFLDWDAPLPSNVESILDGRVAGGYLGKDGLEGFRRALPRTGFSPTGAYIKGIENLFGASPAAKIIRESGIPGIRYFDQGSRGAAQGTRNYVVFDDSLIDIINKY